MKFNQTCKKKKTFSTNTNRLFMYPVFFLSFLKFMSNIFLY